jgi:hypothetical protein
MYCTACKPIVARQLKDEKAVKNIDLDYMTDSVIVEFDPSIITKEEIRSDECCSNTLECSSNYQNNS